MATYSGRIERASPTLPAWLGPWLSRERLAPVISGLIILATWQIVVSTQLPDFVARPIGIVLAIPSTVASQEFWLDVLMTLGSISEGVAIGSAAGIVVGVAMGRVREIDWFLSTYIRALYALPLIALELDTT